MERREFLFRLGRAIVAAPAILSIAACGGGGGTSTTVTGGDFTVTSSVNDAHTHDITVKASDLAAGVSVTYSGTGGNVTGTPAANGHSHGWLIKKP